MTNAAPTHEELELAHAEAQETASTLRQAAKEAEKKATLAKEADAEEARNAAAEAGEAADAAEQEVAELAVLLDAARADDDAEGSGDAEKPKKAVKPGGPPKEGQPVLFRYLVNGPRTMTCPATVKKVHGSKDAKRVGLVDLTVMKPNVKPQTVERVRRGDLTEVDTWSATPA